MKTNIYILNCKGKSFLDRIISHYEWNSKYTHTAYVLELNKDPHIIESWYPEVREGLYSELHKGEEYDIFTIKVDSKQKKIIETFLKSQLGKKYNYLGLLDFVFRTTFFAKLGEKLGLSMFCSELVFKGFQVAGINLLEEIDADEVSPSKIVESPLLSLKVEKPKRKYQRKS